jgi:hypothetical protein
MSWNREFRPMADELDFEQGYFRHMKKAVIKGHAIQMGPPRKVKSIDFDLEDDNHADVEPIIENDEIVGVRQQCTCGREVVIRFEYEGSIAGGDRSKSPE